MSVPVRIAAPTALVLALVLALSACSATRTTGADGADRRPTTARHPVAGKADTASGVVLHAERTTPTDIDLRWRGGGSGASGHVLEFATEESGPYTVLQYLPPQVTNYRHPDLMPNTTFFYRLRAFGGPASEPVNVTLPKGELTAADENSSHDWLPARKDSERTVPGGPLRSTGAGAPTGFKAAVKHANGVLFTWTDHASDEAGFLLEARTRTGAAYEPVVVLDPDVNSTGLITLPTEKEASYRVRAFTYGERSNVVRLTTGESTGP
ncbi:fibronectin type III domain-containing protein [Streptomyces sp. NPDC050988]|uniref:fibronectin type III domain-containing protein n=1 Tax=Streptomyces sp. NPDC050988 TaxID=3365637 RepID=UPI00379841B0